jgi:hypothetical protein
MRPQAELRARYRQWGCTVPGFTCRWTRCLVVKGRPGKPYPPDLAGLPAPELSDRRRHIVDASIINAPSSTRNEDKKRDLEMHQARRGNQWFFGMKAHIGADSQGCKGYCSVG